VTRRWWEQERRKYDLFVSEAVENECRRGDPVQARKRLSLIEAATMLILNRSIMELAQKLVIPGGLPAGAAADAVHIAVATIYQIDYLATWNIRHIANAQIRRITEGILEDNGYRRPIICTPEELFGVDALEG
jgi:predicted nucleic acid-binding protein